MAGHEKARHYLQETGAEVLIWGTVLRHGNKTIPKLYWTSSEKLSHGKETGRYPIIEDELQLPEVFWNDLSEILRLLIASKASQFGATSGRYSADQLKPFIEKVRSFTQR
jgi:hypothetical protein